MKYTYFGIMSKLVYQASFLISPYRTADYADYYLDPLPVKNIQNFNEMIWG